MCFGSAQGRRLTGQRHQGGRGNHGNVGDNLVDVVIISRWISGCNIHVQKVCLVGDTACFSRRTYNDDATMAQKLWISP